MNGKNEPCRLCQSAGRELRFSHIIPEFLYKPLGDEKRRYIALRAPQQLGAKRFFLQKGIREFLLCGNCEQHLAKYERYGALILRKLPDTSKEPPGSVQVTGVDYTKFKIFQLSLLWRAGVSKQASFQEVNLGPHEERLRVMVRDGDPGKQMDYGCILMRTQDPEPLNHILQLPHYVRLFEHHAYDMLLFGMVWIYIVTSHSSHLHEKRLFLSEAGVLPIHVTRTKSEQFIEGLRERLKHRGVS
jgi:hypothetical protein